MSSRPRSREGRRPSPAKRTLHGLLSGQRRVEPGRGRPCRSGSPPAPSRVDSSGPSLLSLVPGAAFRRARGSACADRAPARRSGRWVRRCLLDRADTPARAMLRVRRRAEHRVVAAPRAGSRLIFPLETTGVCRPENLRSDGGKPEQSVGRRDERPNRPGTIRWPVGDDGIRK